MENKKGRVLGYDLAKLVEKDELTEVFGGVIDSQKRSFQTFEMTRVCLDVKMDI